MMPLYNIISTAFEICFDMDSPRVNGSELFLSFESTVPVDAAVCSVDSLPDQDCKFNNYSFCYTAIVATCRYYSSDLQISVLQQIRSCVVSCQCL